MLSFLQVFRLKYCTVHTSHLSYAYFTFRPLHSFLYNEPSLYLAKSTHYEAFSYAIFSSLLVLHGVCLIIYTSTYNSKQYVYLNAHKMLPSKHHLKVTWRTCSLLIQHLSWMILERLKRQSECSYVCCNVTVMRTLLYWITWDYFF
jgi:hypothetical protein